MQRTNVVELKPSKRQAKILHECMLLSSCVYNMTNYEVRQRIINKEKVPNFFSLRPLIQNKENYQRLGRVYALPRIQIYSETNFARFKLIQSKTQKEVGLPKYYKNRKTNTTLPSYLVIDNYQYSLSKTKATLPLSRIMRKEYGIKNFKIAYNGILKWQGEQLRGQIHFKDGKFYLYQSVEVKEPKAVKSKIVAGIDLGIKRLFAIKISNGEDKLIGSKRHFKQWQHYTKLISDETSKLALINLKFSKKLGRLFNIRAKWQDNLYNNLISKTFKVLKRNNVSQFFIGDVKNIREDADFSRKGNQMLHNYWAFDKIYKKCENKSEEFGIEMIRETEEYTSQTCPVCSSYGRENLKDRLFLCLFCGYFDHRDIVGATNIMFKGMQSLKQSLHLGETAHLMGAD
jgi:putative transposase